jgi:hypothetical protein
MDRNQIFSHYDEEINSSLERALKGLSNGISVWAECVENHGVWSKSKKYAIFGQEILIFGQEIRIFWGRNP